MRKLKLAIHAMAYAASYHKITVKTQASSSERVPCFQMLRTVRHLIRSHAKDHPPCLLSGCLQSVPSRSSEPAQWRGQIFCSKKWGPGINSQRLRVDSPWFWMSWLQCDPRNDSEWHLLWDRFVKDGLAITCQGGHFKAPVPEDHDVEVLPLLSTFHVNGHGSFQDQNSTGLILANDPTGPSECTRLTRIGIMSPSSSFGGCHGNESHQIAIRKARSQIDTLISNQCGLAFGLGIDRFNASNPRH